MNATCAATSRERYPYPSSRCSFDTDHGPVVVVTADDTGCDAELWAHGNVSSLTWWSAAEVGA